MTDDPMKQLWLGTEGGSVLLGCYPESEAVDLIARYREANLVHPVGVNNGAALSGCCQSGEGVSAHCSFQMGADERMVAVLKLSLAEKEGRWDDAALAAVDLAMCPRRCPLP